MYDYGFDPDGGLWFLSYGVPFPSSSETPNRGALCLTRKTSSPRQPVLFLNTPEVVLHWEKFPCVRRSPEGSGVGKYNSNNYVEKTSILREGKRGAERRRFPNYINWSFPPPHIYPELLFLRRSGAFLFPEEWFSSHDLL